MPQPPRLAERQALSRKALTRNPYCHELLCLAASPTTGSPFDPACSTISVGTIHGGAARNIIAGSCAFDWELRPLPGDDGLALLARIDDYARTVLLPEMRAVAPMASIETVTEACVPPLNHEDARDAVALLCELTGQNSAAVVSFGTDAGHFCEAGISTVVFGPGSIEQAHKPDEFIAHAREGRAKLEAAGEWGNVAILGRQMQADEPLFSDMAGTGARAGVDLDVEADQRRLRERAHRVRFLDVLPVDGVEFGGAGRTSQEDADPDGVAQREAGGVGGRLEVVQGHARLHREGLVAVPDVVAVTGGLPRQEDEATGFHGHAVAAGRPGGAVAGKGFAAHARYRSMRVTMRRTASTASASE